MSTNDNGAVMRASHRSLRRHIGAVLLLGTALVVGVGGWALTTEVSGAVIASGTVMVENNIKSIQHLTGGIVSEVLVTEGDRVEAGQVLIRLDDTSVRASLSVYQSALAQHYARRARLQAERIGATEFAIQEDLSALVPAETAAMLAEGEHELFQSLLDVQAGIRAQLKSRQEQLVDEVEGLDIQLKAIADSLNIVEDELAGVEALFVDGLVSVQRVSTLIRDRVDLEGRRGALLSARAQAEGRSSEIDMQILQLEASRRSDAAQALTEIEAGIAEYAEGSVAVKDQLRRLDIRAPLNGRIHQLVVHTVNGVVAPGATLMMIVPESESLTVEAQIATHDIDQVHIGQRVAIRLSAFNQRTTPEIDGEVVTIAPDLVTDERTGASYYSLRIRPTNESLAKLHGLTLYPGMPAEVFIKTADRTVFSYLVKPVTDQMNRAFRQD